MTRPDRLSRDARAFTIVEMLVAVAAVTLIALGVAQVFTATGATVRVGRRISSLNERAAVVEHQMRQDIARMTRGGFLVIRNQDVYSGELNETTGEIGPRISADDARTPAFRRPRRIDELMFFAEGQFESQRERVDPSRAAVSTSARIWYGHGLRQSEVDRGGVLLPSYFRPEIIDPASPQAAPPFFASPPSADNPNRYAENWTLLRHVTVLSPPSRASQLLNTSLTQQGLNVNNVPDSAIQIGLQPAASSIFRDLATSTQTVDAAGALITPTSVVRLAIEGIMAPKFSSGLVDIAATDLSEIRSIILDGKDPNLTVSQAPYSVNLGLPATPREISFIPDVNGAFGPFPDPVGRLRTTSFMKQWMALALPADSDGFGRLVQPVQTPTRIRYEPDPPDLLGTVGPTPFSLAPLVNPVRRADQQMLTASNFVPACTEFIVEWSFGETVPRTDPVRRGQLIWHGLPRFPRVTDPGSTPTYDPELEVRPYTNTPNGNNADTHWLRYALRSGSITTPAPNSAWPVPAALVHWIPDGGLGKPIIDGTQWQGNPAVPWPRLTNPRNAGVPLYSMFGYVDPTFDPQSRPALPNQPNLQPDTIPWAWPRLIRVTMSLVDPADPAVEETFQFVFEVPRGSGLAN